jgi:hypothetical protein
MPVPDELGTQFSAPTDRRAICVDGIPHAEMYGRGTLPLPRPDADLMGSGEKAHRRREVVEAISEAEGVAPRALGPRRGEEMTVLALTFGAEHDPWGPFVCRGEPRHPREVVTKTAATMSLPSPLAIGGIVRLNGTFGVEVSRARVSRSSALYREAGSTKRGIR